MSKHSKTTTTPAASFTIKEAAKTLGMSEMYIRRSIQKVTLKAVIENVPGTEIKRWAIPAESLEEWRTRSKNRSKRADGRVRRIVYMNAEEEAELAQRLDVQKPRHYKKAKAAAEPVTEEE